MSKFTDLRYSLRNLLGEIEDNEDAEGKGNLLEAFATVESQIDDIESDFDSIKYDINNL